MLSAVTSGAQGSTAFMRLHTSPLHVRLCALVYYTRAVPFALQEEPAIDTPQQLPQGVSTVLAAGMPNSPPSRLLP